MADDLAQYTDEDLLSALSDDDLKSIAGAESSVPQRTDRLPLKSQSDYSEYNLGDAAADTGKTVVNSLANLGEGTINAVKSVPQIPNAIIQGILHPIVTGKAIGGAIGRKIGQYNTMDKFAEKVSSDPFGFGSDVVNSALLAKGLIKVAPEVAKLKVPMPRAYNDRLVNTTGQSIVSKVQNAVIPLKQQYKSLTEPLVNKTVDSEVFQKALSVVPKSMHKDLMEKYGSTILDKNGNPHTTLGQLQAMELGLADDIVQPKYAQSINAASYDIAKAVKKIKEIRLSEYPEQTRTAILDLDKKFGPVINMSDFLLPKVSNKAGAINTKTLFGIVNNPADAGMREYLKGLKSLGVDLAPEMRILRGWSNRRNAKKFFGRVSGNVAEGATIGAVLKTGL